MTGRRPALGPTVDEERATTVEGVRKRLAHRLPWLGVGLVGAMASAWMVGAAEEELSRTVTVAFFLPAIVYMADAVGTQTEVLAVRGLAVGVEVRDIIVKELVTGFFIGVCVCRRRSCPSCSFSTATCRWQLRCRWHSWSVRPSRAWLPLCCRGSSVPQARTLLSGRGRSRR